MKNEKSKVLSFPGLYERTVEKGRHALEINDYETAVHLFSSAYKQNPDDEYVAFCYMFALDGANEPEQATEVFEQFFQNHDIDDFEMVMFYLNMLFEQRKYLEIQRFIQTLRFTKRIPLDYQSELEQFESLNQKLSADRDDSIKFEVLTLDKVDKELFSDSNARKFNIISEFGMTDIRPFIEPIKRFLIGEEHPTLKSMLFSVLVNQKVNQEITMIQFGETITLNPIHCMTYENHEFRNQLMDSIYAIFEDDFPGIFEEAVHLIDGHLLMQFPLELGNVEEWIVAYEFYLKQAYGIPTRRILNASEQEKLFRIKSLDELPPVFE